MITRVQWACLIGNILDHFDTALFAFLIPVIGPLFFPQNSSEHMLLLSMAVLASGSLSKPLGAWILGLLAEKYGARWVLVRSLFGVAVATFLVAFLIPGTLTAAIFLFFLRFMQGFFAAGELTISSIALLDITPPQSHLKMSAMYQASTMFGIILACCALIAIQEYTHYWYIPFLFAPCTALVGVYLRTELPNTPPIKSGGFSVRPTLQMIFVTSFTYLTYCIPFVFLLNFIPLVTQHTAPFISFSTLGLLCIDLLILIPIGSLVLHMKAEKVMRMGILGFLFSSGILFCFFPILSYPVILILEVIMIVFGLLYLAPLNAWVQKQFSVGRFINSSVGYVVGGELVGRTAPLLCMALYNYSHNTAAPMIYIFMVSMGAYFALSSYGNKILMHQNAI